MVTTPKAKAGRRVTIVGLVVNLVLIGIKFTAGVLGKSQGLVADAVHSVSDLITDAVVLVGLAAGRKRPDERHHFGHGRIETLASSLVSLALGAAGLYIGWEAIRAILSHSSQHPSWLAVAGAAVSVVVKEALYHYTMRAGIKEKSRLVRANALHHRSDSLSSAAVLLGVAVAAVYPPWRVADSIAALVVSLFIFKLGFSLFLETIAEFTDTAPDGEVVQNIHQCAAKVEGVLGVHDLKVRTSADMILLQLHIEVDGRISVAHGHAIAKNVEKCLFEEVEDLMDVQVHMDPK